MQKRVLLILLIIFLVGCTSPEDTTLEVPAPDIEGPFEVEETVVSNEIPVPDEDVDKFIVAEIQEPDMQNILCSRTFSPSYSDNEYYMGDLFDAHFHLPNLIDPRQIDISKIEGHQGPIPTAGHEVDRNVEVDRALCNFEKEQVRGAIGFVMGEAQLLE